jgi:hypothetical protein
MKRLLSLVSMLVLSAGIALAQSNSTGQNGNSQPSGIAAAQSGGAPSQDTGAVGSGQLQGKDATPSDSSNNPNQQSGSMSGSTQSTTDMSKSNKKSESKRETADQPEGIKAAESGGAPTQDTGAVGYDQKSSQGSYEGQKVNSDNTNPAPGNSTSTDNSAPDNAPNNTPSSTNPR